MEDSSSNNNIINSIKSKLKFKVNNHKDHSKVLLEVLLEEAPHNSKTDKELLMDSTHKIRQTHIKGKCNKILTLNNNIKINCKISNSSH